MFLQMNFTPCINQATLFISMYACRQSLCFASLLAKSFSSPSIAALRPSDLGTAKFALGVQEMAGDGCGGIVSVEVMIYQ